MGKSFVFGTVSVALGLSLIPISTGLAGAAAKPAGPSITNFEVSPLKLGPGGGLLHYSANLTDTKTYTLYITPHVAGLPKTLPAHAHVSGTIRLPANHGAHPRNYSLTFSTWDGLFKRVELSVQSIRPAIAVITGFVATPVTFSSAGGVLHYSARLTNTKTYTLYMSPGLRGLPKTFKAHAAVAGVVDIPANHSAHPEVYSFTFGTWGGVHDRVALTVLPAPA